MSDNILVTRSSMPSLDEYIEEIRPIWQSHWLTNMGAKHQQLQAELEEYLGVPHVALYTNGHLALENAIAALNLPEAVRLLPRRLPSLLPLMQLFAMVLFRCSVM